jgi:DNA topoisomerase-2
MTEVNDVKILSDIDHVLLRNAMYIGSTSLEKYQYFLPINDKFELQEIEVIPGLFKIVNEIIDNAIDEHQRGFCSEIWIELDSKTGTYSVKDNGRGISPEKHSESGKFVPEVLFTMLRSGSNFSDEKRTTLGMNGVGAALTNIFSKEFKVEIHRDNKIYLQTYSNNNRDIEKPQILKEKTIQTGTKITFTPDQNIFKTSLNPILLKKRCFDLSYMFPEVTINLKIDDEETKYSGQNFEDVVKMFGSDYSILDDRKSGIRVSIVRSDKEEFSQFSIVNGADTIKGGTHIDYFKDRIVEKVKEELVKKKIEATSIDILKNVHIIVFLKMNAPTFDSQTKERLSTSKDEITKLLDEILTKRKLNTILEVNGLVDQVYNNILIKNKSKELKELSQAQKKVKSKSVSKLIECSSKDRKECTIFLTEGDSAIFGLSAIRNTKKHAGLPLKGKILNVEEMRPREIIENEEIQSIVAVLGLEFGKDPITIVRNKVELNGLRYGNISILTDADHDGSAIRCLLINFFYKFWPSLIEHGIVSISEAPLYQVLDKKSNFNNFFYDKKDFLEYLKDKNQANYEISYFKGLGSCDENGWDYFINKNPRMYKVESDDKSQEQLTLIFGKNADKRKEWLRRQ